MKLRCLALFEDCNVRYDELRITRIDVRTHSGDPTRRYTCNREREWTDTRTGETKKYIQSETTYRQRITLTSPAAEQHYSEFARASAEVYEHAAEVEDGRIDIPNSF